MKTLFWVHQRDSVSVRSAKTAVFNFPTHPARFDCHHVDLLSDDCKALQSDVSLNCSKAVVRHKEG